MSGLRAFKATQDRWQAPQPPLEAIHRIPSFSRRQKIHDGGTHMFTSFRNLESPLFREFQRLEQELDEVFAGAMPWAGGIRSLPPGTFPAINVASSTDAVTVYVFAPGIDAKSLDISLQQNVLSIGGRRVAPQDSNATYYRNERFQGEFRRVVALAEDVDPEKVEASYRDGVVEIRVRRRESSKPRQIEIH
jgi:HSP20 family protein